MTAKLDAHTKRAIAVEARRDPRTVDSVLEGRAKPVVARAIREAAERLGVALPTIASEPPPPRIA